MAERESISSSFYERTYLDTHAERKWQGCNDEKDGNEGEEEGAASGSFGVRCKRGKDKPGHSLVPLFLRLSFYKNLTIA